MQEVDDSKTIPSLFSACRPQEENCSRELPWQVSEFGEGMQQWEKRQKRWVLQAQGLSWALDHCSSAQAHSQLFPASRKEQHFHSQPRNWREEHCHTVQFAGHKQEAKAGGEKQTKWAFLDYSVLMAQECRQCLKLQELGKPLLSSRFLLIFFFLPFPFLHLSLSSYIYMFVFFFFF